MGNVRKIDGKIVSNQSWFLIIQVIIDNYSYACQVKSKERIIFFVNQIPQTNQVCNLEEYLLVTTF